MLIRSIRAENFKKFTLLHIHNIPCEGLIGVEGPNESGKTSLGDAILFAFFGKVSAGDDDSVARLIRWGTDSLTVELDFSVDDENREAEDYRIFRQVDRAGTNYVKIVRGDGKSEVAAGHVQVEEFLDRKLRVRLGDLTDSVFLRQGADTGSGVPSAEFLGRLAGTAQIREAVQGLEKEIGHLEREYANYQKDIERNQDQIDKMNGSLSRLKELRVKVGRHTESLEVLNAKVKEGLASQQFLKKFSENLKRGAEQLENASERTIDKISKALDREYQKYENASKQGKDFESVKIKWDRLQEQKDRIDGFRQFSVGFENLRSRYAGLLKECDEQLNRDGDNTLLARHISLEGGLVRLIRSCRGTSVLSGLLFLIAALLGVACAGVVMELPAAVPFFELLTQASVEVRTFGQGVGVMAGVALLIAFVLLFRRISVGARLGQMRTRVAELESSIEETRFTRDRLSGLLSSSRGLDVATFVETVTELDDLVWREHVVAFQEQFGQFFKPGVPEYRKVLRDLAEGEREIRESLVKESQPLGKQIRELEDEIKSKRTERARAESELRDAENLIPRKDSLVTKNQELEEGAAEVLHELDCRRAAIDLLEETERAIVGRIGPNVSRFVRGVLPALTDNRYRDLKLDDDLDVRLFMSEKCDFVDLHELSGGTLESLRLAFRLALSQALVLSRTRQRQFLFFDDPFQLMDPERAVQTQSLFTRLSASLCQFFLVKTSFSSNEKSHLTRLISTGVQNGDLVADLAKPMDGVFENPQDVPNFISDR